MELNILNKSNSINELKSIINKLHNENKTIIIYGAGIFGVKLLKLLQNNNFSVSYFCDDDENKLNNNIFNINVKSINDIKQMDKNSIIFFIASKGYFKDIIQKLSINNFNNIYFFPEHVIDLELGNLQKLNYDDILNKLDPKIQKKYAVFEDDNSIKIFNNILMCKCDYNQELIDNVFSSSMYFPKDIFSSINMEYYVDAGAYNGDTVDLFIKECKNNFNKIYAFEPEEKNYKILNEFINKNYNDTTKNKIITYKYGLYSESTKIKFLNNIGPNSKLDENYYNSEIDVVKADDFLCNQKISFIKMDIEGAELEALKGFSNTIISQTPKLAISVYHNTSDLWNVPLFIKSLVPNYKIYLRHHSNCLIDTVCYAIIK